MTIEEFQLLDSPVHDWSALQKSLWYDKKGDWQTAHDLIDQLDDRKAAHVHAYLHRKEGDLWNARYWYNRAHQPVYAGDLDAEWEELFRLYF
ncbi:MAG: hypothetical protein K0R59_2239 [Sphingobacterium sp.]|jgi:hypothetical protein|uniref:hypothetical protein n=1 Tax=Sphingobacterium sp. NGMCC 1.201703 TaxID=3388657 RepID=UPI002A664474|nr:hypothetical protein [Sphingobacterium sp.]